MCMNDHVQVDLACHEPNVYFIVCSSTMCIVFAIVIIGIRIGIAIGIGITIGIMFSSATRFMLFVYCYWYLFIVIGIC